MIIITITIRVATDFLDCSSTPAAYVDESGDGDSDY